VVVVVELLEVMEIEIEVEIEIEIELDDVIECFGVVVVF